MTGTATTAGTFNDVLSIKSINDLKREITSLNAKAEWMLVSPNGQMYKGTPQDMMRVLIPFHPIMLVQPDFNPFRESEGSN